MRMQVNFQLSMSNSTNISLYPFPIISPFFEALDQRASFKLAARCLSLVKIAVTSSSASLEVDTASCINSFWLVFLASDLAAFRKSRANYPTPWSFTRFFFWSLWGPSSARSSRHGSQGATGGWSEAPDDEGGPVSRIRPMTGGSGDHMGITWGSHGDSLGITTGTMTIGIFLWDEKTTR